MEFETPNPQRVISDAGVIEANDEPRPFFTSGESLAELAARPPAAGAHAASAIRKRRQALLACGACCAALIGYGVSLRMGGHRTPAPTFSFALPPAQSAAEVKALPPPNLLKPVSPDEAARENAERPFVDRPDTPAARFLLKAGAQDRDRALTCLAQAVYYEAAGEGVEGQRAVAQVVLNRVHHPGFPSTVCGVVYEGSDHATGCQFSFTCDGSMQHIPVPWLWTRSKQVAEEALKGHVFAPVGHATHYHADYVLPYWADSLDKSVQIGRHIFYRLRSSLGDARAFSQRYGGSEPPFREPGTVVVPQTAETQQLTNALIGAGSEPLAAGAEKASPAPSSPLLVDLEHGILVADRGHKSAQAGPAKTAATCDAPTDHKQVAALKADDMRASLDTPDC
jgi:spore germination cell wall hydrolase CwlJ-like protein